MRHFRPLFTPQMQMGGGVGYFTVIFIIRQLWGQLTVFLLQFTHILTIVGGMGGVLGDFYGAIISGLKCGKIISSDNYGGNMGCFCVFLHHFCHTECKWGEWGCFTCDFMCFDNYGVN